MAIRQGICKFSKERRDIDVDIYESTKAFTEIGAGIGVWLRPWRALRELGLTDDLIKLLEKPIYEFPPSASSCLYRSDFIILMHPHRAHFRVQEE